MTLKDVLVKKIRLYWLLKDFFIGLKINSFCGQTSNEICRSEIFLIHQTGIHWSMNIFIEFTIVSKILPEKFYGSRNGRYRSISESDNGFIRVGNIIELLIFCSIIVLGLIDRKGEFFREFSHCLSYGDIPFCIWFLHPRKWRSKRWLKWVNHHTRRLYIFAYGFHRKQKRLKTLPRKSSYNINIDKRKVFFCLEEYIKGLLIFLGTIIELEYFFIETLDSKSDSIHSHFRENFEFFGIGRIRRTFKGKLHHR